MPQSYVLSARVIHGAIQNTGAGSKTQLNITTTTLIKNGTGRVARLFINTAATTTGGGVYDINNTGSIGAANLIQTIPASATVGPMDIDCQFFTGLVINPGSAGVVAVSGDW
jgi:hypothetical protein